MSGLQMKYFVLKPKGNDPYAKASRVAMHAYSRAIDKENPELAKDLREWAAVEGSEAIWPEEPTNGAFRKKPVVVQATKWLKMGDHPKVVEVPEYVAERNMGSVMDCGWIETLEGGHIVTPGDWIIQGVKGEFYPCKPDVFAATYEKEPDHEP